MDIMLNGNFKQILNPYWRKKIVELNDSDLVFIKKYPELDDTIYGGEIGIYFISGYLRWDGEKWEGKMYDVFGESKLTEVILKPNSISFIKAYLNRDDIIEYNLKYIHNENHSAFDTISQENALKIRITDKNVSEIFHKTFYGTYEGLGDDCKVSQNEASLSIFQNGTWTTPGEKLLALSNGW